jgi:hypothetical protein
MAAVRNFASPSHLTPPPWVLLPDAVVPTEKLYQLTEKLAEQIPTPNLPYRLVLTLGISPVRISVAFPRLGSVMEMMIALIILMKPRTVLPLPVRRMNSTAHQLLGKIGTDLWDKIHHSDVKV